MAAEPTYAPPSGAGPTDPLTRLVSVPSRRERLTHVEQVPPRTARHAPWPAWVPSALRERLAARGVAEPWSHQAAAASLAWAGRSVVVATGTASGKSLAYQLPVLSALTADGTATALYLAPTKALAADQLRVLRALDVPGVRAATYDGDTPAEERQWVRSYANLILANPDILHRSLLPSHARWVRFLRSLRFVVIDECHTYKGVFGSHVAQVLRRLRRLCARYGASPTFVLASATVSSPAVAGARLTGVDVVEVTDDGSPRGPLTFACWEPPLTEARGERGARVRRSAVAESADLVTDLVLDRRRTLAFVRSRRGAEAAALAVRRGLGEASPSLGERVAAYRGGYLPDERRALERALHDGTLLALTATNALELGVDIAGLDAVVLAGYPGTRASTWQQAGRAGRDGRAALAVLVARDDPLDTYLAHHPQALFGLPVESTVLDPDNPYVLAPHLCAAAAEMPLTPADLAAFGPAAPGVVAELTASGMLRERATGWYWTRRERACDLADIRGTGGSPVRVVVEATGQLLGTVDAGAAHTTVHTGAMYLHQGVSYRVRALDLDDGTALVRRCDDDETTTARSVTQVRLTSTLRSSEWGAATVSFGAAEVTMQVVSYLRKRASSGEIFGEEQLNLPPQELTTRAVWWTLPDDAVIAAGIARADVAGAAHAAEHAAIGLLPLVATCDRWDVGGVSTAFHPDTGMLTVVVYDGHAGGAGFAERGFETAAQWLRATREAVAGCECEAGCPSCVQSPKCGDGNEPLGKAAAVRLLDAVLAGAPESERASGETAPPEIDLTGVTPAEITQAEITPAGREHAQPHANPSSPQAVRRRHAAPR